MSMAMITLTSFMTATLLFTINSFMMMKPDINKLSPYECGFDPFGDARTPISIQFFLVAILFILFDLEIVLLLPIPWSTSTNPPTTTMTLTTALLTILTAGLLYEWLQGGLEWTE
uniref:NADH-ubiquinone oxidoreductase chain 3 n=1 Tax=Laticauda semifasciata TaxID=8631 RepID=A0A343JZJ0_LATSE|nr:NADH dehydrogenase subunit 3 [Laticauda semifasciata]ASZ83541.1 NADH dehydrogenase subunit 3 [Laticauda semifasciata]